MDLDIYRGESVFATVKIDDRTVYNGQIMGEDKVTAYFSFGSIIEFSINDYILLNGVRYTINTFYTERKFANGGFDYILVFEGTHYTLFNRVLRHLGNADFTYFGTPTEFIQLIIDNINDLPGQSGWAVGTVDSANPITIAFRDDSCRTALNTICDNFGYEYLLVGKTIHAKEDIGTEIAGIELSYGKGNGLYELIREPVDEQPFATRVYGYGSSDNLPIGYRDGATRLEFEEKYVSLNEDIYGVRETSITFDNILPNRTSTVTGIYGEKYLDDFGVFDTAIDFALEDYLVKGVSKIVFKSGDLAGLEFEILDYFADVKVIIYKHITEEDGYKLPNDTVKAAIGDEYTLIGIELPTSYITTAEAALKAATEAYLAKIANPPARFQLFIDPQYVRTESIEDDLIIGNRIKIIDTDMDVDRFLRIQSISYPLADPFRITATLSDIVTFKTVEKIRLEQRRQQLYSQGLSDIQVALQLSLSIRRRALEDSIFDPSGQNIIAYNELKVGTENNYFYFNNEDQTTADPDPISGWPYFQGSWLNKGRQVLGDLLDPTLNHFGFYGTSGVGESDIVIAQGAASLDNADILVSPFNVQRDGYLTTLEGRLGDVNINSGQLQVFNVGTGEGISYKDSGALNFKSWVDSLDIGINADSIELNAYLLPSAINDRTSHTPIGADTILVYDSVAGSLKKASFSDFLVDGSKWTEDANGIYRDGRVVIGGDTVGTTYALEVFGRNVFRAEGLRGTEMKLDALTDASLNTSYVVGWLDLKRTGGVQNSTGPGLWFTYDDNINNRIAVFQAIKRGTNIGEFQFITYNGNSTGQISLIVRPNAGVYIGNTGAGTIRTPDANSLEVQEKIKTGNVGASTARYMKFGDITVGTVTPDRLLRIEHNGVLYDLTAKIVT